MTFISEKEIGKFKKIEKLLGKEVRKLPLPENLGSGPDYKRPEKKKKKKFYPRKQRNIKQPSSPSSPGVSSVAKN